MKKVTDTSQLNQQVFRKFWRCRQVAPYFSIIVLSFCFSDQTNIQ